MTPPTPLAAALDALGVRARPVPQPQPPRAAPVWMPTKPGEEPPF